jgi:hypothetical protein
MDSRTERLARDVTNLGRDIARSTAKEADLRSKAAREAQLAERTKSPTTERSHRRWAAGYLKKADAELAARAKLEGRRAKVQKDLESARSRAERMFTAEQQRQQRLLQQELDRARAVAHAADPVPALPPDAFICHADEDKDDVARPLAHALLAEGVPHVWFDEFSLRVGQSLRRSIDQGLATCRFGVVVLSRSFFAKGWPQEELDGLVERMISEGRDLILPVWHDITKEELIAHSPPLSGRYALLTSTYTIPQIAERLADVILDRER